MLEYLCPMPVSFAEGQAAITAGHLKASELGITVTVVVVDEGGYVICAGRMDGAPSVTPQVAEAKACGAAIFHRNGEQFQNMHRDRPGFFAAANAMVRTGLIPGLGSALIRKEGVVLGAVGVSGGVPDQDLECAEAAVAALVGARRSA